MNRQGMMAVSMVVALVGLGLACSSCTRAAPEGGAKGAQTAPTPAVPVGVAKAQQRDMPIELRSVGTVEPVATVTLRPQVSGQVKETPAGEGRDVQAGDVVIRIDPRPFEATLREAEASLLRVDAVAKDERRAAEQMKAALASRATSTREAEQAEAKAVSDEAQVTEMRATIETAKLNLEYCTIRAPFAGRLGALRVKIGAVVKQNEADLIDLTQVAPIDVGFALPEGDLPAIQRAQAAGAIKAEVGVPSNGGAAAQVAPIAGALSFIDNKVDANTGTVRLKARFENADRRLWPGQFVNITITVGQDAGAVVVPASAVLTSQKGSAVFVVKPDQTAEFRPVNVKRTVGELSVIDKGLTEGEVVVTDGQLRLVNGAKVVSKETGAGAVNPARQGNEAPGGAAAKPAGTKQDRAAKPTGGPR